MKQIKMLACLAIALMSFKAGAAEVTVQNTSTDDVKLYSNDGRGWTYEGTVRSGSRIQRFQTNVGDNWGFSDPHNSRIDIIKEITVRSWGSNALVLTDRDLGHNNNSGGGGGRGPVIQRQITINNYSSEVVEVYSDHGHGWHSEGTIRAGGNARFPVDDGDAWGIDDPFQRGANIIKQISITRWDPAPGLSINDRELGVKQPLPNPFPGGNQQKSLTAINQSDDSLKLYVDEGTGFKYVDKVRSNSQGTFEAKAGDVWCFADPHKSGIVPIKTANVRAWGSNVLTVTENDVHGGGANPAPPIPFPFPKPPADVAISFKNQSINKANISVKTGPFSKKYLDTVGPWGTKTFNLTPGDAIVIEKPGSSQSLMYRVPNSSETFPFKPKS